MIRRIRFLAIRPIPSHLLEESHCSSRAICAIGSTGGTGSGMPMAKLTSLMGWVYLWVQESPENGAPHALPTQPRTWILYNEGNYH